MAKAYQRIMLKFSGEVLKGDGEPIDFGKLEKLCKEIKALHKKKLQIAIVVGGGNIWRFRDNSKKAMPRVDSDYMGMMATIMNASAMRATLERLGVPVRVMSAMPVADVAEGYSIRGASEYLDQKHVVICAGGTGRPFFTTDSAAALRGLELGCDVLLKATKVDGVYDKDPAKHKNAKRYESLSFDEVLKKKLAFMDQTASALCREGELPVVVFDLMKKGNLAKVVARKKVGTTVHV